MVQKGGVPAHPFRFDTVGQPGFSRGLPSPGRFWIVAEVLFGCLKGSGNFEGRAHRFLSSHRVQPGPF